MSKLSQKLKAKEFVITGELEPKLTIDLDPLVKEAETLKKYVDAANITDNPGSFSRASALASSIYVKQRSDIDLIYQITCRDFNRLSIVSNLVSAATFGIENILAITGDHSSLGDMPQARPVFDLDSAQLVSLINEIRTKNTAFGVKIEVPEGKNINFTIGIGTNPNSTHPEAELMKMKRKSSLGVDFIQTQVIYDVAKVEPFLAELKKLNIPIIAGIFPMKNYRTAHDFDKYVPGVKVPKELLEKFKYIEDNFTDKNQRKEKYDELNAEFFKPLIKELKSKGFVQGIHVMAVDYARIFPKLF